MSLGIKILVLLFSILLFAVFISVARKRTMKTFYSTLWLMVAFFMLSLVIFERFYKWFATAIGISDASFFVIVSLIAFLLVYVLHLSEKVSEMSSRIQELISHHSILENEIRRLNNQQKNIEKKS
jgi:hypothetical protein